MSEETSPPARTGAQAVERALRVMRALEESGEPLGITELARQTALTISTAHRMAKTLADRGLLAQDPITERYQLGPALVALGEKAAQRLGYDRALPALRELSATTGESINLGIRAGNDVHVALHVPSPQPLRFDQPAGTTVPLHVSAMGKCLLACVGEIDDQVESLGSLPRVTDRSITQAKKLKAELELVRQRGWAINDEERNPGVRAIAVPVLRGETAVAAIAVQGPSIRVTEDRLGDIAAELTRTAGIIAPGLGPYTAPK
ncbi:IclR family transcriptional regulator [Saccharopolyspora dendranthemae]|uniref:Glycerol operon regulatory protein n=1 Tax=Saccharopolyspora dendranthemae TaxID=1181886 RepID=A0A561U858_9PSEU|nr:IclR family transcriptional regulator [Saccharopolyspora dendranthemae]TWF95558.1 IclR family transcriptional regulator [Saccharopolyspora dendranthemae]